MRRITPFLVAAAFLTCLAPAQSDHQQKNKNQWRNIGTVSGALGVLGLLKGNSTLAIAGLAGALYSADRYERDRRSQARDDRARASLYGRSSFRDNNGHRYVRRTVYKDGHKFYKFVRG